MQGIKIKRHKVHFHIVTFSNIALCVGCDSVIISCDWLLVRRMTYVLPYWVVSPCCHWPTLRPSATEVNAPGNAPLTQAC